MTSRTDSPLAPDLWVPWSFGSIARTAEAARASGEPVRVAAPGWEHLAVERLPGRKMLELGGWSGTEISGGGIVNYDHNPNLSPEDWRGTTGRIGRWGEMLRSDPVVMSIWGAWTVGISSTPFTVEPADGDRTALQMAAFIRAAYEEHSAVTLRRYLRESAPFPLTGSVLHELAWRKDDSIGASFGVDGPMLTLATLEPRLLRTVAQWRAYEDPETLAKRWGVVQYPRVSDPPVGEGADFSFFASPETFAGPELHPDRLIHLTWNADGTSPEGIGILRACHASYAQRVTYTKLETAGFERSAFGIPVLKVMPNAPRGDDARAWEAIQNYRVGGRHGLVLPTGYDIEFAKPPFDASALGDAKRAAGREMCRAAHAMHLYTGEDNGTEALISGQLLAFTGFLQSGADAIAETHSHGPHSHIHRLIDANWSGVATYPRMQAGRVRMGDIQRQADYIKAGVEAGALTPGVDLEDYLRRVGALPDTPPETREQWEARVKTPKMPTNVVTEEEEEEEVLANPAPPPAVETDESGEASEANEEQAEEAKTAARARLASLSSLVGVPESGPGGRPVRPEEEVCRLAETKRQMESSREEIISTVVRFREQIAEKLADRLVAKPDLASMRGVSVPGLGALTASYEAILRRAYKAGAVSVENEIERMGEDPDLATRIRSGLIERGEGGDDLGTDVEGRPADIPVEDLLRAHGHGGLSWSEIAGLVPLAPRKSSGRLKKKKAKSPGTSVVDDLDPEDVIRGIAGTTVDSIASRILGIAIGVAQAQSVVGAIPGRLKRAIREGIVDAIGAMSTQPDGSAAQRDANTSFGLGRAQEGRASGATHGVFSNLIESQTCDPCAAQDGRVFLLSRLDEFATPYSECEGGDRCNCLVFFVEGGAL